MEIPLHLRLTSTGKFRIATIKSYGYGLNDRAELYDRVTGLRRDLLDGNEYEFDVESAEEAESCFVIVIKLYDGPQA